MSIKKINFITNKAIDKQINTSQRLFLMNTLTIPSLSLFPHKKTSHHLSQTNYLRYNHTHLSRNNYATKLSSPTTHDYYPTRGASSNNRYKQIAEDYLDKRTKSPSYYIESTPYLHNVPSFLPRPQGKEFGGCQECDNSGQGVKRDSEKRGEYFWMDRHKHQETRLLKDPYLEPTFREGKGFVNSVVPSQRQWNQSQRTASNNLKNVSKLQSKQQPAQSLRQQIYVSKRERQQIVTNSKIMQKLKTHQSDQTQQPIRANKKKQLHQAQIQTVNVSNHSMNVQTQKIKRDSQRPRVQKILEQQKMLIQSLKLQIERQGDFKHEVEDLESTKNDYIEKSRQLLLKLNELADDKREFGFVVKSFANTKKTNVFRDLDF